ncbi:class I SAM-dependent methyltransferase [Bacillus solitudinis]|uniref:class I SAM-dependent methyltransferase n=1 Tax=Bacillus solitudinis TaxID=2014074 RepID=UPI001D0D2A4C|nr:class I SAM-dependent methyltransferase [Bacillus solitudinis]
MKMKKMEASDFDSLVPFFDAMAQTSWLSDIHHKLMRFTGAWTGKDVIDIGCGTGRLLARGVEDAKTVTGVDLSKEMVDASLSLLVAKGAKDKSSSMVADAYKLPFSDNSFDISLSTCVMFLLPEPEKGIKEMIRVTRPNGVIGMLNPSKNMNPTEARRFAEKHNITGFEQTALVRWSNVSTARHRYAEEELTSLLEQLGTKSIKHQQVLDGLAVITVAEIVF